MIVCWVYCLIAVVLVFLDLNLVILHIYLNVKGITTFQLLQVQKEEEKEKKRKVQERQQIARSSDDSKHEIRNRDNNEEKREENFKIDKSIEDKIPEEVI